MTTTYLISDLERDEGEPGTGAPALEAYPDPRSKGPPWTIGWGHTGPEVHPGLVWTTAQCQVALANDVTRFTKGCITAFPFYDSLTPLRQDCLVNMAFNLGVHGLMGFHQFLGLLAAGKYPEAVADLRHTPWFAQVGERAERIAAQLITNVHQE